MERNMLLEAYLTELEQSRYFRNRTEELEELRYHILRSYREYIEAGFSEEMAARKTIEDCGQIRELIRQYRYADYYTMLRRILNNKALIAACLLLCVSAFGAGCIVRNNGITKSRQFYQAMGNEVLLSQDADRSRKDIKRYIREYGQVKEEFGNQLIGVQYLKGGVSMICVETPTRSIRDKDGVWKDVMLCSDGKWRSDDDVFSISFETLELQRREQETVEAEIRSIPADKRYFCEITADHGTIVTDGDTTLDENNSLAFQYKAPEGEYDAVHIVLRDLYSEDVFVKKIPLHFKG